MQVLLILLLVIIAAIGLLLFIGLFSKKSYTIQRDTVIDKPVSEVFHYLKHLRNQERFSKWVMADPDLKKSFKGTDGTVGFVYAWEGNKKAGKGEQEIMAIRDEQQIDVEIRFEKPFKAIAKTPFVVEALSSQQTKVRWEMSSALAYPANIMLLFNIEKVLAKDMEISLTNLKNILEGKM